MTDTDTPPSTPRAVIETLREYPEFGVPDPLLAAILADRADAGLLTVRATIEHMEQTGDIYSPDGGETWKPTRT